MNAVPSPSNPLPTDQELPIVPKSPPLPAPDFSVEWSVTAQHYLPLFEHLALPEQEKLQLISDLLAVIDHTFDACLTNCPTP